VKRKRTIADRWASLPDPVRMIMMIGVLILVALLLPGCATKPQPVTPPRVAVPVACQESMPERPEMPTDQLALDATVDQYIQAAEAEIQRREGYEQQLATALQACRKPVSP